MFDFENLDVYKLALTFAKGSAYECVPLISLFHSLNLLDEKQSAKFKEDLQRISQMLTKLIQSLTQL